MLSYHCYGGFFSLVREVGSSVCWPGLFVLVGGRDGILDGKECGSREWGNSFFFLTYKLFGFWISVLMGLLGDDEVVD